MSVAMRFTVLFSSLIFVVVAGACQAPPLQQAATEQPNSSQAGETMVTSQPEGNDHSEASLEKIAAEGVRQAQEAAPQVADEISSRYWFSLPKSVPWWASQPVVYEEGDRSQGVIRLRFHKQHYRSHERASAELGLLWQQGKVEGSPDASFQWAARAGIDVGEEYELSGTCVIDGRECQIYRHRRPPQAGNLLWRIWYDDNADLTYALVIPEDEPEVGRAFEQEFRGSK